MIGLQCLTCTHRDAKGTVSGATACAAFPDGIPVAVLTGVADHRQPYDGDHGVRYSPIPGTDTSDMDDGILEPLNYEPAEEPLA